MLSIYHVALVSLLIAGISTIIIACDVYRHRQQMTVMNFVWPIAALYAGPLALLAYYKIGRNKSTSGTSHKMMQKPFWQSVLIGTLHCGSGCTVGDLLAETFIWFFPVAIAGNTLAGTWTIDYLFAFSAGIIFQYYAIMPMKKMSPGKAIVAALKADALSLTFWQIGMYGWMAICFFVIYDRVLPPSNPVFWLMMQIAMIAGLATAYPINWWLLKKGIKEIM